MQRLTIPVLFAALVAAATVSAQAPAPNATVQTPSQASDQAPASAPVPGGGQLTAPAQKTPEEARKALELQAQQVSEMQARAFAARLGLSPAQLVKLRPILADRQKRLRGLVDSTEAPEADRRAKMQQIEAESEMHIKTILTPEQRRRYEALTARSRAQRARHAALPGASRRAPVITGTPDGSATPAAGPAGNAPAASPAPPAAPQPQ